MFIRDICAYAICAEISCLGHIFFILYVVNDSIKSNNSYCQYCVDICRLCPLSTTRKQDFINFFLQETLSMYLKLASKIWCHFVSNLQRYYTIMAYGPKRVWQFASEKLQYTGITFI